MIRFIWHKLSKISLMVMGYSLIWLVPVGLSIFTALFVWDGSRSLVLSPFVGIHQGFMIGLMQFGLGFLMLGIGSLVVPIAWYSVRYLMRFSVGLMRLLGKFLKRRLKEGV
ncbi:hypothetical protein ACVPPR_01690 [Dellaglioa sp. L3N]